MQVSWPLMRQQASSISINMSFPKILDTGFVFMSKVPRQDEGESGALMERRWVAPVGSGATWGGRCQDWMPFTSSGVRKVPRGHLLYSNPSVEGWPLLFNNILHTKMFLLKWIKTQNETSFLLISWMQSSNYWWVSLNWITLLNHNTLLTDAVEWIAWSLFLPLHHCS